MLLQEGGWTWRYRNEHCQSQNKHNMECYTLPLSRCTMKDALHAMTKENLKLQKNEHMAGNSSSSGLLSSITSFITGDAGHSSNPAQWSAGDDLALVSALVKHGQKGVVLN